MEAPVQSSYVHELEARVKHLEKVNRWTMDALDLVVSFGDFRTNIKPDQDTATIFSLTRQHLKRLIPFSALAFLMVNESNFDFVLTDCEPETDRALIQKEIDIQTAKGTFAWALRQNRAVIVPTEHFGHALVFHPLATRSDTVGMFVGMLAGDEPTITNVSSNLLTVILFNTAHALENSALYNKINDHNRDLEKTIKSRTQELRETLAAAEAANIAKSQFLANMSHEIRTPLNGVLGFLDLLDDTELTDEQKEYITTAKVSANSLLTLINDILDFSKIEAGKLDMESTPFNSHSAIEDTVASLRPIAYEKGIELAGLISPGIPENVLGDPGRFRQIILNLAGNAIKFTEKGKVVISAELKQTTREEVVLLIKVSDTGIGIAKKDIGKLFKHFSQVDASTTREFGGTGLGLAISKQLVEMMGGRIGVESEGGKGSIFWFTVRLEKTDEKEKDMKQSAGQELATHTILENKTRQKRRILVVEDNLINQKLVSRILQKQGFEIDIANNGKEAVKAVRKSRYDLIFMDCQMPVMNGYNATRAIRNWEKKLKVGDESELATRNSQPATRIPIVALTAHAMEGERGKCIEAGMDDYLSKPVKPKKLYEVIDRCLYGDDLLRR